MDIKYLKINDLKPYKYNPRDNKRAIEYVQNSIEQFGMKVPIVIDKDNVIVCGHTRYAACKNLNMEKVPCIVADDLNEKQIKAFRLADNKVAEKARWDFGLLELEFKDLTDFNMVDFGFDFDVSEKKQSYKNQEFKTINTYNMIDFNPERCEGEFQMPTLFPCDYVPKKLIGFNYAMSSKEYDAGIHFYLDDYQFERVWVNPEKYIEVLKNYDCVLSPSYSLYLDMAEPVKIWNTYRTRLLSQIMQNNGLKVIPIVYWADENSYKYCFDGLPKNSTVSVYTVGITDPEVKYYWDKGMDELIKRKSPKRILLYGNGNVPDYDFGKIEIITYTNGVTERMKNL